MSNIPILDFKVKKPTHLDSMEALANQVTAELQTIHDHMTFLHESQLVIMRRLVEKKIITPPQIVEMSHEQAGNNNFRLMLVELDATLVEKHNAGIEVKSRRSFKHWIKDLFAGKDTRVKLTANTKKDDVEKAQKLLNDIKFGIAQANADGDSFRENYLKYCREQIKRKLKEFHDANK